MSDRDELAALIDQYTPAFDNTHDDSVACADAILAAGWRRSTVTPEQVEAAAQRMYASFHEQAAKSGHPPTPYDFVPWGESSTVTKFWLEIAQAGLSVAEDVSHG